MVAAKKVVRARTFVERRSEKEDACYLQMAGVCPGSSRCFPMVGIVEVGEEGSGWCLPGFGVARRALKEGEGVYPGGPGKTGAGIEDRSVTLSRRPTQPHGGGDCYPRARRKHSWRWSSGKKTGPEHSRSVCRVWPEACRW